MQKKEVMGVFKSIILGLSIVLFFAIFMHSFLSQYENTDPWSYRRIIQIIGLITSYITAFFVIKGYNVFINNMTK